VEQFPDWKRYGYWAHRPRDPALAILSERISLLEKKVASLGPKGANNK
jgi:hypothetical protein